jgi:predicted permease
MARQPSPATVIIDQESQQLWVPIQRTPQLASSGSHVFGVVGRLLPGVTDTQASEALQRATDVSAPDRHGAHVRPLRDQFVRDARNPLIAVAGAAIAVLLIACANLASLYVSAFEARRREFAVRAAIGGGIARLMRQVALETLVSAVAGGVAGLAMTQWALTAIPALLPASVPFLTTPAVDPVVFALAVGLAVVAALMMTAWPIARLIRTAPAPRGVAEQTRGTVYRVLVVSQIALAVMLIASAGLLSRSLSSVQSVDPGVVIENVLVGEIALPLPSPEDPHRVVASERALLDAVRSVPGVAGVAAAYDHPLEANWSEAPMIVGDTIAPEQRQQAELRIVSPGYFDAMGVEVLGGRPFSERDGLDSGGVAVVNEAFAREIGGRALGRRLEPGAPRFLYGESAPQQFEIVGVVENERFRGLEAPPQPAFYLSTRQFPQTSFTLLVRTSGIPLAAASDVRATIQALDRATTFSRPTSLGQILSAQLAARRVTTSVLGGFALAALALAALGLYGLVSVFVARRVREIGVRVALGASPGAVARGVMRESVSCAAIGVAMGSCLALAAGRFIESLLVGVSARDPVTLIAVTTMLFAVATAAALMPARRAARVDPVEALRAE